MSEAVLPEVTCTRCRRDIEACDCCDEPGCQTPVCCRCLREATRESLHEPYQPEAD